MLKFALISLISDQPMPNVMAVLQREQSEQAEQRFTHLEFIVSADKNDLSKYDRRFDEIGKRLETFFKNRGYIVSRHPPVDPYNIKTALKACKETVDTLKEKGYNVVFNITGGTKLMSLAAYLCTQYYQIEAIYVESRDRFMISVSPEGNLFDAIGTDSLETERKPLQEELFREIDVSSYLALYGKEVDTSILIDDVPRDQVDKARIIAQYYAILRNRLKYLENEIRVAYNKTRAISWPFQLELKKLTRAEREALECFNANDILSWNSAQNILSCDSTQRTFLKGKWLEVFVLDKLSTSGRFHDVRGNVKIKGWDGECDVMLTVNAQLAIIECKSNAKLSEQFGKIRALQHDRGGLYGRSFFIRSGEKKDDVDRAAEFYGINKVIDAGELPKLVEIVAQNMGIQPASRTITEST